MHTRLHKLPVYDKKSGELNVILETPKGNRNKFSWDEDQNVFVLKKILPEGHVFPFDFGFIPSTKAEDGDAVDVLVLSDAPIGIPGCLVHVRLLGVIEAEQTEREGETVRNDRLIGVTTISRLYEDAKTLDDLHSSMIEEIENFFISYNHQAGKQFKPVGRSGPERAKELVEKAR